MKKMIHQTLVVLEVVFARLRFLAVFVVAGLVVGYWDNIKNHVDKWTRPAVAPDALVGTASAVEYYCVMHPNVIRSEPGDCPICGMPLAKRKKGEKVELPEGVLARVQLTPRRISLAGIQTSVVEPRELVHEIRAVGALDYNEMKVAQLSARVAGRADQLFVTYTGQAVKQGEPVYSLYSPEVYTAMREYLEARKRVNELVKSGGKDAMADASAVYNASMQKLVLWGISSEQLDKLDKEYDETQKIPTHISITSPISGIVVRKSIYEGGYVQTGDTPYTIADLGTLWLQARIYEEDVPLVKVGDEAAVMVDAMPNETFKGKVTFLAYQLDPQTRTLAARVEVANPELKLRPGMFAEARVVEPVGAGATERRSDEATEGKGGGDSAKEGTQGASSLGVGERARVYQEGLKVYLQAQKRLVEDTSEGVSQLLHEVLKKLEPIAKEPGVSKDYEALTAAVHKTMGQDMGALRETFKDVSGAMIRIGKTVGLPGDAPAVQEFRCPMVKANWLQEAGDTLNPYDPKGMLHCGSAVANLPKVNGSAGPATRPAKKSNGAGVLAVPRSAVIDTGHGKVVFVESAEMEGVYDMRQVKLGRLAGEYYPVVGGLEEGEKVVTVGAFLLDAENRLNPSVTDAAAGQGHQH